MVGDPGSNQFIQISLEAFLSALMQLGNLALLYFPSEMAASAGRRASGWADVLMGLSVSLSHESHSQEERQCLPCPPWKYTRGSFQAEQPGGCFPRDPCSHLTYPLFVQVPVLLEPDLWFRIIFPCKCLGQNGTHLLFSGDTERCRMSQQFGSSGFSSLGRGGWSLSSLWCRWDLRGIPSHNYMDLSQGRAEQVGSWAAGDCG